MPRRATFALGIIAVLFSAGSVGSQDPFRARSEAESAATALPVYAPDSVSPTAGSDQSRSWKADHAPTSLVPQTVQPEWPDQAVRQDLPAADAPAHTSLNAGGVATLAVAAPSIASFVSAQARALVTSPAGPVETAAQPQQPPASPDPVTAQPAAGTGALVDPAVQDDTTPVSSLAQKRLFETVPQDITPYFDLFMYVSKSTRGPLAQHMFIFQRDADGNIIPYAEWKVSTGREKIELHNERRVRTNTPEGIFQLDPDRMYARYWSHSWNNAPMHYAMFYDLMNNGSQSGLAIHAAVGASKIARLGKRDSAGCIRLSPKNAAELFYKVRNTLKGRVPVLAMNEKGSTDRWGRVQHDQSGAMLLQDGYRAVLFVENFDGREEISGPVVAYTN
jgi:lipoprotein-anchoring transpeptidase ErfK/SrfK